MLIIRDLLLVMSLVIRHQWLQDTTRRKDSNKTSTSQEPTFRLISELFAHLLNELLVAVEASNDSYEPIINEEELN